MSRMCVFSIIAHESPNSVKDLCENIHYFVKDNHKIIIHTNPEIDEETRNLTKHLDYVYIFPKPFRKKKHNSILWKSHIENFEYLQSLNIKFNKFIMLASNCLFINEFNPNNINKNKLVDEIHYDKELECWAHYNKLKQNHKLMDFFQKNAIKPYLQQHEGMVIETNIMKKIISFQNKHKILDLITKEFCLEEIIPVSLYIHIKKENPKNICFIYRKQKKILNYHYQEIKDQYYSVKRIDRNPNDPIRTNIKHENNNYELE